MTAEEIKKLINKYSITKTGLAKDTDEIKPTFLKKNVTKTGLLDKNPDMDVLPENQHKDATTGQMVDNGYHVDPNYPDKAPVEDGKHYDLNFPDNVVENGKHIDPNSKQAVRDGYHTDPNSGEEVQDGYYYDSADGEIKPNPEPKKSSKKK